MPGTSFELFTVTTIGTAPLKEAKASPCIALAESSIRDAARRLPEAATGMILPTPQSFISEAWPSRWLTAAMCREYRRAQNRPKRHLTLSSFKEQARSKG